MFIRIKPSSLSSECDDDVVVMLLVAQVPRKRHSEHAPLPLPLHSAGVRHKPSAYLNPHGHPQSSIYPLEHHYCRRQHLQTKTTVVDYGRLHASFRSSTSQGARRLESSLERRLQRMVTLTPILIHSPTLPLTLIRPVMPLPGPSPSWKHLLIPTHNTGITSTPTPKPPNGTGPPPPSTAPPPPPPPPALPPPTPAARA